MSGPDWRNAEEYEFLRAADVATLAGEFLRRNREFQADRERLARLAAERRLSASERDAFALAWGVRFRGTRRAHEMDAASTSKRRRHGRDAPDVGGTVAPR